MLLGFLARLAAVAPPSILRFPNPVNEVAARLVAGGVVIETVVVLAGGRWALWPLAIGFVLRVLFGPRVSPLALLVTRAVVPALGWAERPTAGPPKRFAQGIGAVLSTAALVSWLAGAGGLAVVCTAMITFAATLESGFGYCLGCRIFGLLMKAGVIPDTVCSECNDISARLARRSAEIARASAGVASS